MLNWSMIPVGTPLARFSARWVSRASSTTLPSNPSASATATSSAWLLDIPPPMGMVVVTCPRMPMAGDISDTTPATYLPHAGETVVGSSTRRGRDTGSASSAEVSSMRSSASNRMSVQRSTAIGNTSPPV